MRLVTGDGAAITGETALQYRYFPLEIHSMFPQAANTDGGGFVTISVLESACSPSHKHKLQVLKRDDLRPIANAEPCFTPGRRVRAVLRRRQLHDALPLRRDSASPGPGARALAPQVRAWRCSPRRPPGCLAPRAACIAPPRCRADTAAGDKVCDPAAADRGARRAVCARPWHRSAVIGPRGARGAAT